MSRFTDLVDQYSAARNALHELAKEDKGASLLEVAQPLFDLGVPAVGWEQHPPNNEDGDPSDFRIYGVGVLNGHCVEDKYGHGSIELDDDEFYPMEIWSLKYYLSNDASRLDGLNITADNVDAVCAALKTLEETVQGAEEYCRVAFGDAARVIFSSDGTFGSEETW